MMQLLISRLLTLLIVMLAGGALSRLSLVDTTLRKGLNRLLFFFVLPVMVFTSMRVSINRELLQTSYWPVLFGAGLCLVNWAVSMLFSWLLKLPEDKQPIFSFLNMFGNNIYLGIPIALALFGTQGVAIVLLFSLGSDIILWSLGLFIITPGRQFSLESIKGVFTPTLVGLLLGAVWGISGVGFPVSLANAMDSVGAIASPMALLLTGAALAEINFSRSIITPDIPALMLARLMLSPLLALAGVSLLQLPEVMKMVVVIVAGMPTFVRSIVITDQYGWDGQQTATGVLATTLGSFLSIPLILYLVSK